MHGLRIFFCFSVGGAVIIVEKPALRCWSHLCADPGPLIRTQFGPYWRHGRKLPKSQAERDPPAPKRRGPRSRRSANIWQRLLNPALNQRQLGVSEGPQAEFEVSTASRIDARLLGLETNDGQAPSAPLYHPLGMTGVAATVESLKDLLERGDPNIREKKPWTPHRPPRPEKSEGGRRFRVVSEYRAQGRSAGCHRRTCEGH